MRLQLRLTALDIHHWHQRHPDTRQWITRPGIGDRAEVLATRHLQQVGAVNLRLGLPDGRQVIWGCDSARTLEVHITTLSQAPKPTETSIDQR